MAHKETRLEHHASGTFDVKVQPGAAGPAENISRFTLEKQIHGGIEGTSAGEMLSAGDPKAGAAGYVAIERVTGKVDGKSGSFVLQQIATMDKSGRELQCKVTPGSGTGELQGIAGTFDIRIENGQHNYTFDYTLPQ